jgi:hypothetical protein
MDPCTYINESPILSGTCIDCSSQVPMFAILLLIIVLLIDMRWIACKSTNWIKS